MIVELGGRPVVGLGLDDTVIAPLVGAQPSTWAMTLATSVVGAAAGWVIEEIANSVRGKRRRAR